jgi:CPA1 family monovalent cation:H+ antiporter
MHVIKLKLDYAHGKRLISNMGMNIRDELAKIDLFSCLTDEQLDLMARGSRRGTFLEGRNLITQDEEDGDVLLITSGEADVIKHSKGLDSKNLATVGSGTILGEMSALTEQPAAADVIAKSYCECVRIPRKVFLEAIKKNMTSMSKLTTTVVKRFRAMMNG